MEKKEVIFKKFIEENEILVVDKNPGSRNRLLKIVVDLGAKRHMVHTAGSLIEATQIISEKKISLVLSDYFISGGSGFDLFKLLREQQKNNKKLCLVLVTSNISQTAVAKAAEEDVDSFIIKPYTLQSIQENLISVVAAKVKPSEYILKIEEGKSLMQKGDLDKAMSAFKDSMKMHQKPALALFYMGQIEYMKKYVNEAQGDYQQGLGYNTIHFKCLVGLYELFLKENKFEEAYSIVRKISKYFPANPDRLTQIIRLAIQTKNYQDMQAYYEVFTSLDERTPALVNYIGAGLYISGKYFIKSNEMQTAMQIFDSIAVSCSEYTKFTRAMITLLVEHSCSKEAEKYLTRFPVGSKESEDYLVSDYLVNASKGYEAARLVKQGLDLYNQKIRDIHSMKILIKSMEQSGYKEDKLSKYRKEFSDLWPEGMAAA